MRGADLRTARVFVPGGGFRHDCCMRQAERREGCTTVDIPLAPMRGRYLLRVVVFVDQATLPGQFLAGGYDHTIRVLAPDMPDRQSRIILAHSCTTDEDSIHISP